MKKFLLALITTCISSEIYAQALDTRLTDIATSSIVFRKEFIQQHKIKQVQASIFAKADNMPILDKGLIEIFKFDTTGKLTEFYYTRVKGMELKERSMPAVYRKGRKIRPAYTETEYAYAYDTVFTYFYYNPADKIIGTRSTDNFYYDTHYYEYDSLNRIKKETRCRETNAGNNRFEFKLGVQQVMSLETFEYAELSPTQTMKRSKNDEGRDYKKTILNYDSKKNLLNTYDEFIVGWVRVRHTFAYDSLSRLTAQVYEANASGDVKESFTYAYDTLSNVTAEKKFKNDVLQQNTELVYDKISQLLTLKLTRYFLLSNIGIVKYSYRFY